MYMRNNARHSETGRQKNIYGAGGSGYGKYGGYTADKVPISGELPLNYGGTLYGKNISNGFIQKEETLKYNRDPSIVGNGINGYVKNEGSFSSVDMANVSDDAAICDKNTKSENPKKGIESIVGGLFSKDFRAEDILLVSVILLMLNSESDSDIIMILALMILM